MNILGIIPARYASTRFPAKPLALIDGISMIQRVYQQALKSHALNRVIVATDHDAIFTHVNSFGGNVMMTAETHISGTDRCCEVLNAQSEIFDFVINIQGDEPFIAPEQINLLATTLTPQTELATLIKKIEQAETLANPNIVKVVIDSRMHALYFSRSPIPYIRHASSHWHQHHTFYKHIGMYAYRTDILRKITLLEPSGLEKAESLEQLRWLENGYKIVTAITGFETMGIDTPEDLREAEVFIRTRQP
jgi:3-deoxy-manno-octulosonate cytidylyltransferase (CMP-KDO synthetase)